MQYLWKLKKGFLKDIVEQFPEPRPAYTTISTVVRVLVKKGYIGFRSYGKVNEYFPKLGKNEYAKKRLRGTVRDYFEGSLTSFASFFTNDKEVNINELEEIKAIIESEIKKRKEE